MTNREPPGDARRLLVEKWRKEAAVKGSFHATMGIGWKVCADELEAALSPEAVAPRRLPCTCGPPSFPYQEHDGDCPRGLAEAVPSERMALERLSLALTQGNASTWDEIFDAAERRAEAVPPDDGCAECAAKDFRIEALQSSIDGCAQRVAELSAKLKAEAVPSAPAEPEETR